MQVQNTTKVFKILFKILLKYFPALPGHSTLSAPDNGTRESIGYRFSGGTTYIKTPTNIAWLRAKATETVDFLLRQNKIEQEQSSSSQE